MHEVLIYALVLIVIGQSTSSLPYKVKEGPCDAKLDIILLIDSSESVQDVWNTTIDHAETFEYEFFVSDNQTRIGIIDYSIISNVYKHLDSNNSNEETLEILEVLRRRPQNSRSAFERGVGWALELFSAAKQRENSGRKVLVIYTDAVWSTVQSSVMEDYIGVLRLQGVEVFFFLVKEISETNILRRLINPVKIFNIASTPQNQLVETICNDNDKDIFHLEGISQYTNDDNTTDDDTNDVGSKNIHEESLEYPKIVINSHDNQRSENDANAINHSNDEGISNQNENKVNLGVSLALLPTLIITDAIPQFTSYKYPTPNRDNIKIVRPNLEKNAALYSHNYLRALHGAPKLVWDDKLGMQSQEWAEKLVTENRGLYHSGQEGYGENIYSVQGESYSEHIYNAALYWYQGIKYYKFENPGFSWSSGTFTQLVWRSSTKIGVGVAYRPDIETTIIVAQYSPPGNYLSEFQNQVKKPLAGLPARIPDLKELIPPGVNASQIGLCTKLEGKCRFEKVSASGAAVRKKSD